MWHRYLSFEKNKSFDKQHSRGIWTLHRQVFHLRLKFFHYTFVTLYFILWYFGSYKHTFVHHYLYTWEACITNIDINLKTFTVRHRIRRSSVNAYSADASIKRFWSISTHLKVTEVCTFPISTLDSRQVAFTLLIRISVNSE